MSAINWSERPITGALLSDDHRYMLYPLSDDSGWWAIAYAQDGLPTEQTDHADCDSAREWCEQHAAALAATTEPTLQPLEI